MAPRLLVTYMCFSSCDLISDSLNPDNRSALNCWNFCCLSEEVSLSLLLSVQKLSEDFNLYIFLQTDCIVSEWVTRCWIYAAESRKINCLLIAHQACLVFGSSCSMTVSHNLVFVILPELAIKPGLSSDMFVHHSSSWSSSSISALQLLTSIA